MIEGIVRRLEGSSALNKLGEKIGSRFVKIVRPGPLKNVLSGSVIRHPAHPFLTDVTIGAWTSAVLLDVLGVRRGAELLVGIGALSAAPTAVTGLTDFADITEDKARGVGTAHAIGNVLALGLFAGSWFARRGDAYATGVVLSAAGLGVLTAAGFLGGHLAFRRGIGVDQTIFEQPVERWTPVMDADDLDEGKPERVSVEGRDVMVYRTDGKIYALASRCTHRGGPLHEGEVRDGTVTCPWHLSAFRLEDGEIAAGPATAPAPGFDVRVHDGKIEVRSAG